MVNRDSRHLYDIAKIMPYIKFDNSLHQLILKVRKDRKESVNNPSANEKYDISQMLTEIASSHFFEKDYKALTTKLLFEEFSYERAIEEGIKKVAEKNIF